MAGIKKPSSKEEIMKRLSAVALSLSMLLFAGRAEALDTVKITNIGHAYWAGPLYVAQYYKLFEKHGLNAEVTEVKGGSLAFQAALTKGADLSQVTFEHVLKAASQGQRVVSFYRFGKAPANNIVANNEIMSRAKGKSVEERVLALKGARVALPSAGGSNEKMLEMLASVYGLDMKTVERLYLGGNPGSYVAAFQGNQIDAAVYAEPVGLLVSKAKLGGTLLNVIQGEEPRFNDVIFLTLVAHPDIIAAKADILRKVCAAYDEALKIMHTQPEKGIAAMAKEFPSLSAEDNAAIYNAMLPTWPENGKMNAEQAKRTMAYMTALGDLDLKAGFDPAALFSNDLQPK
jgi:NitT/TauT family transport system substrate-binding protein